MAQEIREIRDRLGLSQAGLAALFGGAQPLVARWETGGARPPKASMALMRLLDFTGEAGVEHLRKIAEREKRGRK